ncbi:MAG: hypothetical protein AAF582_03100 [Pseudomonadota bacterium]
MAAERKPTSHETGDAKMKAAAIKAVKKAKPVELADPPAETEPVAVPSPAKALQDQLHAHYSPLSKRMQVILVSLLVAFAFISGWLSGSGNVPFT